MEKKVSSSPEQFPASFPSPVFLLRFVLRRANLNACGSLLTITFIIPLYSSNVSKVPALLGCVLYKHQRQPKEPAA